MFSGKNVWNFLNLLKTGWVLQTDKFNSISNSKLYLKGKKETKKNFLKSRKKVKLQCKYNISMEVSM